jgi:predicted ATPase
MFRKLYLKNFKVWGDQLWDEGVELAPVTLLLGTNSAGKTSLLQALLLLKQTFQSPDPNLDLNLGGQANDIADFGRYEDIVHEHEVRNELGLAVDVQAPGDESGPLYTQPSFIRYRATFTSVMGVPEVARLSLSGGESMESMNAAGFSLTRGERATYGIGIPGIPDTGEATRSFHPEKALFFPQDALSAMGAARDTVQKLSLEVHRQFRNIYYLGPLREYPQRSYLWNSAKPGEIGPRGEQAVSALLASDNAPKRKTQDDDWVRGELVEHVSRWLAKLGIADKLVLEKQGRSRHYDVVIKRQGASASLIDVGFGVSQVLPMLVLAYFVPRGATIVAEQPEIHLHPLAQAGLADLMTEVAHERDVQFIVETHSEYMFRHLQLLIAEEKLTPAECRLYFVSRSKQDAATLSPLHVDEFGRISNWPSNFFGDALGDTEQQMARMMERMIVTGEDKQ